MQPYAHGEVELSVRYNQQDQFKVVDQKLKKMVPHKKYANAIHFQIEGGLSRNPLMETEKINDFYSKVKEHSGMLDIRITKEHRWSSSDICFADPDLYILDGFGPIGKKVEGQSEFILRHSLLERTLLIASSLKHISAV